MGIVAGTWLGGRRIENSISALGGGCRLPRLEGLRSEGAKRAAVDETALNVESVVVGGVNGQEALC
jgi:hypothetical protein